MSTESVGVVPTFDQADRMRRALRTSGVGVQEIADYLGVRRNTVSNWINGRVNPSTQTMRLWALRCGVPYEWLTTGMPGESQVQTASNRHTVRYAADTTRNLMLVPPLNKEQAA
jgi:transcriptional regulator with XRE-family HTH domain